MKIVCYHLRSVKAGWFLFFKNNFYFIIDFCGISFKISLCTKQIQIMNKKFIISLTTVLSLVLLFICQMASAQTNELKTLQVNIFKNGTYFISKEAKASGDVAKFPVPPGPLQSTFWIYTTKDNKINRIDVLTDTVKVSRKPASLSDYIIANKGKKASITYTFGQGSMNSTASGVIKDISFNMLKLEDIAGKTVLVNMQNVLEFSLSEKENSKFTTDSTMRIAKVYFKQTVADEPILLSYMSSGIQWLPSYSIRLSDAGKLQLEMKALIENYSEGILNADVVLTVGKPQMLYGAAIDPIVNDYFSGGGSGGYTANPVYNYGAFAQSTAPMMYDNSIVSEEKSYDGYAGDLNYTYNTEGEKTNDLYIYKLGKVSLPKNTKSSFSIFSSSIPYEDLYEVNINDYVNFYSTQSIQKNDDRYFEVYHSLRITNATNFPFTTAPVFVQDEKLNPLAQDQIKYTPKGSKVKVQLSKAVDVQVKGDETELSRSENLKKFNNSQYRKVTIKGVVHLENLQDKNITLNVTKAIMGEITEVSDGGVITKPGKFTGLNPNTSSEWNIELSGNQKKDITYTYDVWIYAGN